MEVEEKHQSTKLLCLRPRITKLTFFSFFEIWLLFSSGLYRLQTAVGSLIWLLWRHRQPEIEIWLYGTRWCFRLGTSGKKSGDKKSEKVSKTTALQNYKVKGNLCSVSVKPGGNSHLIRSVHVCVGPHFEEVTTISKATFKLMNSFFSSKKISWASVVISSYQYSFSTDISRTKAAYRGPRPKIWP